MGLNVLNTTMTFCLHKHLPEACDNDVETPAIKNAQGRNVGGLIHQLNELKEHTLILSSEDLTMSTARACLVVS